MNWARATTRNGSKCATAGGEVHLSNAKGDALTLDQTGMLCKKHVKGHPHDAYGEPMPVVNSPRMGMCGYEGPAKPPY